MNRDQAQREGLIVFNYAVNRCHVDESVIASGINIYTSPSEQGPIAGGRPVVYLLTTSNWFILESGYLRV